MGYFHLSLINTKNRDIMKDCTTTLQTLPRPHSHVVQSLFLVIICEDRNLNTISSVKLSDPYKRIPEIRWRYRTLLSTY
jgi:hypothetical protein